MNQKGNSLIIWIFVIILIILGALSIYYILSAESFFQSVKPRQSLGYIPSGNININPTPDPTVNWQIYLIPDYGFEVKYPNGWFVHKYEDYKGYNPVDLVFTPNEKDISLSNASNANIGFTVTISNIEYNSHALSQTGDVNSYLLGVGSRYKPTTFQGLQANKSYLISTDTVQVGSGTSYLIFNNGKKGWSLGWPNKDYLGNYDPIYDQILSTFKFTDQSSADTSSWKTYNNKYYYFKYPSNWTDNVSEEQYFETGTLIHTNDVKFTDFSNFQKGALLYTTFISEKPLSDPELTSIDEAFSKLFTAPEDMSLSSESALVIDSQPAKEKIYKGSGAESIQLVFEYPNAKGYGWFVMDSSLQDFDMSKKDFASILSTFKFN